MVSKLKVVFVILWVQVGVWIEVFNLIGVRFEWVEIIVKIFDFVFVLRVKGDLMIVLGLLSIFEGVIVIVDLEYGFIEDVNEKIVIVQMNGNYEVIIKKFVIDGFNKYLMLLNF